MCDWAAFSLFHFNVNAYDDLRQVQKMNETNINVYYTVHLLLMNEKNVYIEPPTPNSNNKEWHKLKA